MKPLQSPRLRNLLTLSILFLLLVPIGAVIMHRSREKFVETLCLVAGPYVIISCYVLFSRKHNRPQ